MPVLGVGHIVVTDDDIAFDDDIGVAVGTVWRVLYRTTRKRLARNKSRGQVDTHRGDAASAKHRAEDMAGAVDMRVDVAASATSGECNRIEAAPAAEDVAVHFRIAVRADAVVSAHLDVQENVFEHVSVLTTAKHRAKHAAARPDGDKSRIDIGPRVEIAVGGIALAAAKHITMRRLGLDLGQCAPPPYLTAQKDDMGIALHVGNLTATIEAHLHLGVVFQRDTCRAVSLIVLCRGVVQFAHVAGIFVVVVVAEHIALATCKSPPAHHRVAADDHIGRVFHLAQLASTIGIALHLGTAADGQKADIHLGKFKQLVGNIRVVFVGHAFAAAKHVAHAVGKRSVGLIRVLSLDVVTDGAAADADRGDASAVVIDEAHAGQLSAAIHIAEHLPALDVDFGIAHHAPDADVGGDTLAAAVHISRIGCQNA